MCTVVAIVSAFPALSRVPVIGPKILLVISVAAIGVMCLGNRGRRPLVSGRPALAAGRALSKAELGAETGG